MIVYLTNSASVKNKLIFTNKSPPGFSPNLCGFLLCHMAPARLGYLEAKSTEEEAEPGCSRGSWQWRAGTEGRRGARPR
jgi:hypothetical protein